MDKLCSHQKLCLLKLYKAFFTSQTTFFKKFSCLQIYPAPIHTSFPCSKASIRIILISLWYSFLSGNFLFLCFTSGSANPYTTPKKLFSFSSGGLLFLHLAHNDIKYYTEFLLRWTFHLTLHGSAPLNLRFHIHISSNNLISIKHHLLHLINVPNGNVFFAGFFVVILSIFCFIIV